MGKTSGGSLMKIRTYLVSTASKTDFTSQISLILDDVVSSGGKYDIKYSTVSTEDDGISYLVYTALIVVEIGIRGFLFAFFLNKFVNFIK